MRYDILVIGSGPGGYAAAIRAAQLGRRTAVVECDAVGGTCLNWGCIPTKALLRSAEVYQTALDAAAYGVRVEGSVEPDFAAMIARSRTVAGTMSRGVDFLLGKNTVEVIPGRGRLVAPDRVAVAGDEGERIVEADRIILATGARPREIEALPVDHHRIITSRDALALDRQPRSIVVVGSGAIGSEFASFFARIGTAVTLVEYLPRILPLEDEEVSRTMERAFRKLKVTVLTSTEVKRAQTTAEGVELVVEGRRGEATLEAECVLSAVGIVPNLDGLGLEELGVRTERGRVAVDERYRTSVEGIYAIGDIVPGPALAHVATAEAIVCVESICGLEPAPIDYTTLPSCVYTHPEVASVGLTEQQAAERGIALRVGRYPFTASGRATAAGARDGFAKLLFDERGGLVGAHLVGDHVTELIAEPTVARALGATAAQLARIVHPHPTMSEALMEAAAAAAGEAIHL